MSDYLPPVVATLKADESDYTRGMKNVREDTAKTERSTTASFDTMKNGVAGVGKAFAVGMAVAGAAVIAGGAALYKVGEQFDDAYDTIRVGTGETGKVLDMLKDDFRGVVANVPTDFAKASQAVTQLHQRVGDTGPTFQLVSQQMLELSRITKTDLTSNIKSTQDAFAAWGVDLHSQPKLMDELFRTYQATGVSVDSLASTIAGAQPQLHALGFSFEQSAALAGTLGAAGADLSDVLPAMSKALAAAAKEGKPAQKVFSDTFDAIKNAPNATAAAGDAMAVFGAKSGPKLAEMIRSGKLSYQDLLTTIQGGSDSIIGAGKETQDFSEKWQLFKNKILLALEPIAARVFDAVGNAMDKVGPYVTRFSAWFGRELPVAIGYLEPKITAISAALTAAFVWFNESVLPVITDGLQRLGAILTNDVWPATQAVFGFLMDHKEILEGVAVAIGVVLVGAVIAYGVAALQAAVATALMFAPYVAAFALLAALAAGIIYAYNHFDTFRGIVDKVAKVMREDVWPAIKAVASWIKDELVPAVIEAGQWIGEHLGPIFAEMARVVRDDVVPAVQAIVEWVGKVATKIASMASTLSGWVVDVWKFGGQVLDFFRELPGKIGDGFITLANAITSPFRVAFNAIVDLWNHTIGSLSFEVPGWVPGVGGKGWSAPKLDHWQAFEHGGIVQGPVGQPVPIMAHGGEQILTVAETRAGGRGGPGVVIQNLTVHAGIGVDGQLVGQQIITEILKAEKYVGKDWRDR